MWTHIDHSIGGDAEEGGSFVHSFHSVAAVGAPAQFLQFVEGALESGAVFSYQLMTGAQVVYLVGQSLEHPLGQGSVLLGDRSFISRVIFTQKQAEKR